ncbi:uncharacterized protein LOC126903550 isoform X2 [Daktulosphaira vitifoliae]|uniref:uncharacterized protein LOC126903550 isoform X2 n=1 Tax=Daktulosphaira vitifoliae TaxID=58002 RepID=UPI0021A9B5D6|nr:uncharacterized protein LOC126903550 isoform X2 [Daktulosphaira vitifoliae]
MSMTRFLVEMKRKRHKCLVFWSKHEGKYWMDFKEFRPCNSSNNYLINFNIYTKKLTEVTDQLLGNITLNIPFDDSLEAIIKMGQYDSTGLWKDNVHVMITKNVCSGLKNILGPKVWLKLIESFHFTNNNCPWQKGHYESSGFDTALFGESNAPKRFFYGIYTTRYQIMNKQNNIVSCTLIRLGIMPYPKNKKVIF